MTPSAVVDLLARAAVVGRGGAHFPAALKWQAVATAPGPRVLVVNGGEHEPGSRKDAWLLARRFDLVLEGLAIAGAVLDAKRAFVVLDPSMADVIDELTSHLAQPHVAQAMGDVSVDVVIGPDSYLVGEESALLEVLEGHDALPRFKPPRPAEYGYDGYPTLVHNVETLANVAWVLRAAADGVSDPVVDSFVWTVWHGEEHVVGESPIGVTVGEVLARAGVDEWKAVTLGGFSGGVVTADEHELQLVPLDLARRGLGLGCAAFRVLDVGTCAGNMAVEIVSFFARESCGQCVPCKVGLRDVAKTLAGVRAPAVRDVDDALVLAQELRGRGRCALPDGAALTLSALWDRFEADLRAHARADCGCR